MTIPRDAEPAENEEDDYYFDGPYLVFTEAYHLKRGFCCQSNCRHCPYGFSRENFAVPNIAKPDKI